MGKRQFVLKGNWAWDHSNDEIITFTIEGDVEEEGDKESPIYIGKPLTRESFPQYFDKNKGIILDMAKNFRATINNNPMSDSLRDGDVVTLYEIAHPHGKLSPSDVGPDKFIAIKINPGFHCRIDANGNMVTL